MRTLMAFGMKGKAVALTMARCPKCGRMVRVDGWTLVAHGECAEQALR
jgi:hypothetical protein